MNDSLKEIIKEVIKDFFIITVAMLFVVSLANSIALIEYYPPYFPWVVMGTGAVTSIPTLLFYFNVSEQLVHLPIIGERSDIDSATRTTGRTKHILMTKR